MTRNYWNFQTAGRLVFGDGAVQEVGPALKRIAAGRVFVVTDETLVTAGVVDPVLKSLRSSGFDIRVFSGGEPEPSFAVAERAFSDAQVAAPAVVVGLGGGSNIDLAKIVSVLLTHGGQIADYAGFDKVPGPLLPLVCVPTTSGTGSEVSHAAVLTDTANRIKVSAQSQYLRPAVAVVDPELTWSCPPGPTAHSGIDALTHAIEAFTATHFRDMELSPGETAAYEGKHPLGDVLAERAIRLIQQHLETAVRSPLDREARAGMALAATLAGMAFSNCAVALVHAMEYPVGGAVHVSHGEGNGLLLPHVLRFTGSARPREFALIANWLGRDTSTLTDCQVVDAVIEEINRLNAVIGIRPRLRDLGVTTEQLPGFAASAFSIKRLVRTTPRPVTLADVVGIYGAAF